MVHFPKVASLCSYPITMLATLTGLPCLGQWSANLRILPLGGFITLGAESSTQSGYSGPLSLALSNRVSAHNFIWYQIKGGMSDPDNEGRRYTYVR